MDGTTLTLLLPLQALQKSSTSADSSVSDLFHSTLAQSALSLKVDAPAALKNLLAALKKDDSLNSLGQAFRLAARLEGVDAKPVFDRVGDAVVQADEVDGKVLQFEGGLAVTNLILSGAYELAAKVKTAPPVTKAQAVKFANYFLGRKSVQTAESGLQLLEALTTLTANKYHVPVAITLEETSTVVSEASPKVFVRVTDLLGKALGKMDVTVESAMRVSDGAVIMSKSKMAAGSDGSSYEVDMMAAKPGKGFYELTVTAEPAKADAKLVGNVGAVLLVKALGSVVVTGAEIGVADADQTTPPKLTAVAHPAKLTKGLDADHHHKIIFKFTLKDKTSSEKVKVHQAFVRMVHVESGGEIIFVAEPDSALIYKFDLDLGQKGRDFGGRSGKYQIHLIVGDAVISNPFSWYVGDIDLKLQASDTPAEAEVTSGPKPEIRHLFREPEKRPPASVSNLFTVLCLLPFGIMIIAWMKIGVNVSGFPFSLSALGFHLGLGAIFVLYYYFWLELNMFTTIKFLIMIGVVTFLCGNSLLVRIAEKKK